MPQWKNVSEEAKKVVSRMLVVNPDRRATIDELLRDPWLASKHKEGEANLKGNIRVAQHINTARSLSHTHAVPHSTDHLCVFVSTLAMPLSLSL